MVTLKITQEYDCEPIVYDDVKEYKFKDGILAITHEHGNCTFFPLSTLVKVREVITVVNPEA